MARKAKETVLVEDAPVESAIEAPVETPVESAPKEDLEKENAALKKVNDELAKQNKLLKDKLNEASNKKPLPQKEGYRWVVIPSHKVDYYHGNHPTLGKAKYYNVTLNGVKTKYWCDIQQEMPDAHYEIIKPLLNIGK